MTDEHYKEGIKHIDEINQEYIAKNNRMTDEKFVKFLSNQSCEYCYFKTKCNIEPPAMKFYCPERILKSLNLIQ